MNVGHNKNCSWIQVGLHASSDASDHLLDVTHYRRHLRRAQGWIHEGKIFLHTLQHGSFLSLINLILWAPVPSPCSVHGPFPQIFLPVISRTKISRSFLSSFHSTIIFLSSPHLSDLISFSMSNLDVPPSLLSMDICTLAVWLNPINWKVSNGESFVCRAEKSWWIQISPVCYAVLVFLVLSELRAAACWHSSSYLLSMSSRRDGQAGKGFPREDKWLLRETTGVGSICSHFLLATMSTC